MMPYNMTGSPDSSALPHFPLAPTSQPPAWARGLLNELTNDIEQHRPSDVVEVQARSAEIRLSITLTPDKTHAGAQKAVTP